MSVYDRILSDLVGTLKDYFSIGNDVKLKANSGRVDVRDIEDSEYIDLKTQRILLDNNAGRTLTIDVDFTTSGGYEDPIVKEEFAFNYQSVSPMTLLSVVVGERVRNIEIKIETPFDDPTATLSVGHTGSQIALMNTGENVPYEIGIYEVLPNFLYGGNDSIKFYINSELSTQGSGYIFIETDKTLL